MAKHVTTNFGSEVAGKMEGMFCYVLSIRMGRCWFGVGNVLHKSEAGKEIEEYLRALDEKRQVLKRISKLEEGQLPGWRERLEN